MSSIEQKISTLSNERLDSEIANIYWNAAQEAPGVKVAETGLLKQLWDSFDYRVKNDTLDVDDWGYRPEWS